MPAFDDDFARDRLILIAAPNGARRAPAEHPTLPTTPAELADCAAALLARGVSVLHLHVRDAAGRHTLDPSRYAAAIAAIRERVGDALVLQVTTEAVGQYLPAEQMRVVRELKPEAVSLALRELVPDDASEREFSAFCGWMRAEAIWPQYILYSVDDVRRFESLRRRGVLAEDRPFCLLVLGSYAGRDGGPGELSALLAAADTSQVPWAVCCFGPNENAVALQAAAAGGHVRLGFENNIVLSDGSPASDNAALIEQFLSSAHPLRRSLAAAEDIRAQWP